MRARVIADGGAELARRGGERDYDDPGSQVRRDGQQRSIRAVFRYARSEREREHGTAPRDENRRTAGRRDDPRRECAHVRIERRDDHVSLQYRGRRTRDQDAVDDDRDDDGIHRAMRRLIEVFRDAGLRFSRDGFAFFAQALAFNAIFAVFPILVLTVAVLATLFGDASGQARALTLIETLAPGVQGILVENLEQVVRFRGISGLIAFAALLWSGKNLFQGIAFALNRALDVPEGRPLVTDVLVALVMLPILGALFVVATTVPLVIAFVVQNGGFRDAALLTQIAGYGTSVLLIFVVAMVLYDYLPNRRVKLSFGVPGAIVFTVAWEVAQIAFTFYSTHVNYSHVYGALAAFALLLVWFYYMATIFLFGAQVSAQWAARST